MTAELLALAPWLLAAAVLVLLLLELYESSRPDPPPRVYLYPLRAALDALSAAQSEGDRMRLSVAVGAKMSLEAWATVTLKLLDLTGGALPLEDRRAVERFVDKSRRAWADLEQRAAALGQEAPPAPVDR